MVAVPAFSPISPEDYLAAEVTSSTKHEYRDGHLYAMAGGTDAHITIALNFWALLRSHLRNRRCRAYVLDRNDEGLWVSYCFSAGHRHRPRRRKPWQGDVKYSFSSSNHHD